MEHALQDLGRYLESIAPIEDARQTAECPSFTQLAEWADGTTGAILLKSDHIAICRYCQTVIAGVQKERRTLPQNSAPVTDISAELRTYAATWFRSNQPGENEVLAGWFDSEGTLHLSLSDLTIAGPVRVRLVADEMPLALFDTEITGTDFETAIALPEWDLRDVRIARSCVELVMQR